MNIVNDTSYKVLVRCMTYNQSAYIEDALKGFVMQQTDFPFVCLVMDDASTDGEQEVIKAFLERECDMDEVEYEEIEEAKITIVPHKGNRNCLFVVYFLKQNLYGSRKKTIITQPWLDKCKFIALCEGDDYWIDPYKLQKQVDILDKDVKCSLTLSNGYLGTSLEDKRIINPYGKRSSGYLNMHTLLISKGGLVPTASMCFRATLNEMPDFFYDSPVGDKPLRMWCALNGKVFYDKEPQVLYRQRVKGSFNEMVSKDKSYAYYVYSKFCEFLDNFNKFTHKKYALEIKYMKEKEKYYYLRRVNDKSMYKCYYFLFHAPIKFRIRQIIKNVFHI